MTVPTQVRRPWKATLRTAFQAAVGAAPLAPAVYSAATHHDPAAATGLAAVGLGVAAGVTRVMALPQVETWLQRWLPWLAADPAPRGKHEAP